MTAKRILIINGPNLNLLGKREPEVYGNQGFESFFEELKADFPDVELHYFQSNIEGEIIDKLHEVGFSFDGIVINAGGYTHTSVAIGDAVAAISTRVIEVHISNTSAREEFRHQSMMAAHCVGVISGMGLDSYRYAIDKLGRL
jgi:3-dehydroquinate dehydratase-2